MTRSLKVSLNGALVVHASVPGNGMLEWTIVSCRREQDFGYLSVDGLMDRDDNLSDHVKWIDRVPLSAGDLLEFEWPVGAGASPVQSVLTHERLEELRVEANRAEAAGEFDEVRRNPPPLLRDSCAPEVCLPDGRRLIARATQDLDTVICSGGWVPFHRPEEVQVRLRCMRAPGTPERAWLPIDERVSLRLLA